VRLIILIAVVTLVGCTTTEPSYYEPPATTPIYK
jgi:hypothetical protein